MKIKIEILNSVPGSIWDKLEAKLGRAPTSKECRDECRRIISAPRVVYVITAAAGGREISRQFETLDEAQAVAGKIYRDFGMVVGIEGRKL
jgi:hypothetical protein